jgi:hypothetical protein
MASTSKGKQRAAAQDVEDEHPKFKEVPPAFFQAVISEVDRARRVH